MLFSHTKIDLCNNSETLHLKQFFRYKNPLCEQKVSFVGMPVLESSLYQDILHIENHLKETDQRIGLEIE